MSAFVFGDGGKRTCLKFFSTGKIRCLKSDFVNADEAMRSAQNMIDEMSGSVDSGMPPIRLRDAKFNENSKDYTWSTRQTIDIRRLSAALRAVGIKAESDTSFGDSIMVVITPDGTDRQIKGQVLADGTIRLAGCRDDGELAAHAVAASLNESGALQGGPVDLASVCCEVWLTKRSFQVCSEHHTINMDKLFAILNDPRQRQCHHPVLSLWLHDKYKAPALCHNFIKSIQKVGTACPRLEVKFAPLLIDEWEQARRCKPEPVSISIHNKGEVQLAGNAEYKVLQAVYYLTDIVNRYRDVIVIGPEMEGASVPAHSARTPKRKLEVTTNYDSAETLMTPTPFSVKKQRAQVHTPATTVRPVKREEICLVLPAVADWLQEAATRERESAERQRDPEAPKSTGNSAASFSAVAAGSAEVYHYRQLVALGLLRMCQDSARARSSASVLDEAQALESLESGGVNDAGVAVDLHCKIQIDEPSRSSSSAAEDDGGLQLALLAEEDASPTCATAMGEAESPPVSPKGLECGGHALGGGGAVPLGTGPPKGRDTPISPTKVAGGKARRKSKSVGVSKKASTKAMSGLIPMAMGLTAHAPMPHAWVPHGWAHMPYPSPWVATLTNVVPIMHP